MQLIAVEFPSVGVALCFERKPREFLSIPGSVSGTRKLLQVLSNQLIYARSQRFGTPSGPRNHFIVNRKRDVHGSILRAHVTRVNGLR